MWMLVLTFLMAASPNNIAVHTYVGQVTIGNFANKKDCDDHLSTVVLKDFDTTKHNVSAVCQPQPR